MDKRIIKTKKALQNALISLLEEKEFEAVKTTEICERAEISRNTFYSYYPDKYGLLTDCFKWYEEEFLDSFEKRQKENNSGHDIRQGYINLVDTFLDTDNIAHMVSIFSGFDLMSCYYRTLTGILERLEDGYANYISPEYDTKQINAFLILGFWGFIHAARRADKEKIRQQVHKLILDLLPSPVFCLPKY